MTITDASRPVTATAPTQVSSIAIVGLGYVGLPTALAFASAGTRAIGIDIDPRRIDAIHAQRVDLIPDDELRLADALAGDKFVTTTDLDAVSEADAVIVCVPTPVDEHLSPDLSALAAATKAVVDMARPGQVIVLTSTSYVGTTADLVVKPLLDRGLTPGVDVHVVFSPERVDPANETYTMGTTPRVVGGLTSVCATRGAAVIGTVAPSVHVVSSLEAAELSKLHENTFRAVNIAYVNELAEICGEYGLDVTEVIDAAATKPYGFMAFRPGPGVGGHCIPCDPHYLLWQLRGARRTSPVVAAAMQGIAERPRRVVERAAQVLASRAKPLMGARVLVVGVAYKPSVQDVRESPALEIIDRLRAAGADVSYADPYVAEFRTGDGDTLRSVDAVAQRWDLVLVHTLHPHETLDWAPADQLLVDCTYRLPRTRGTHHAL